jgi:hypothetical protein
MGNNLPFQASLNWQHVVNLHSKQTFFDLYYFFGAFQKTARVVSPRSVIFVQPFCGSRDSLVSAGSKREILSLGDHLVVETR